MTQYSVEEINLSDWISGHCMNLCYQSSFGDLRDKQLERCDYVMLISKDSKPCAFITCIEMDSETIYWQFGGAFDEIKRTISVAGSYMSAILRAKKLGYSRITTRIENTNIAMLRLAMKCGFVVVGVWNFKGVIFLELLNDLGAIKCQ